MQHIGVIKLGKKTQKVQCGRKHTVKEHFDGTFVLMIILILMIPKINKYIVEELLHFLKVSD